MYSDVKCVPIHMLPYPSFLHHSHSCSACYPNACSVAHKLTSFCCHLVFVEFLGVSVGSLWELYRLIQIQYHFFEIQGKKLYIGFRFPGPSLIGTLSSSLKTIDLII